MRSKLLSGSTVLALTALTVVAGTGAASARPWFQHRYGYGWPGAAIAAGVVGGAVAAATSPFWAPGYYNFYPGYAYAPTYGNTYGYVTAPAITVAQGDVAYCEARFRSYNPAAGTYLGYDGLRHPCP
jgi:BA14K-like protein